MDLCISEDSYCTTDDGNKTNNQSKLLFIIKT